MMERVTGQFVHLHVHSEYSLLDGAARVKELAREAARLGMPALALTDHGVMYGAVAFYKACKEAGVKPIIGCEVYMTTGSIGDKGTRKDNPIYHLILLARNMNGYRNLLKLCSIAHLDGFHYKPRVDLQLLAQYADGLVCTSSCLGGEISQHLLYDRKEEARAAALRYREIFGDDFYLEIQDHGLLEQKKVMLGMIELAKETGIPLVATNDAHYIRPEDHAVQDILLCIGTGKTLEEEGRMKFHSDQLYLKSADEMSRLFAHVPEALQATLDIAGKCNLELELGKSILPEYKPLPEGMTAERHLRELCADGLRLRYERDEQWGDAGFQERLRERLHYELDVIVKMGFADYFLIVADFIHFAHEQGIAVGPGRGSSAGSLVAYVLRITDVDPIRYRLLFERFLNPQRITMPDIDIDFSDERRDEVIDYVVHKYGKDHVAQIITFGTMAARAAVRDVGRVLNTPFQEVDRAAKMIPQYSGMTIRDAVEAIPELKQLCAQNARVAQLIGMAEKVEGMPRHASTHAAGVVISREPLTEYVPLQEGTERTALTQYTMEHLEAIGLLKMDFLGLRTLSIIERTLKLVREEYGVNLDFHGIADDDPLTYEMLGRGDTTGIFQLESAGMRKVLKELKPSKFEDIISVLALYRPGPMEFIPKFIECKHGISAVEYPHPVLEPILADTYGIIVYQEQIMQIASTMAGFNLGEADLLRRAVSKKKREVLDEQRAHFVSGSAGLGYTKEDADRVYDMIVRFADYGFPRAHATAYGVLSFQTAYLKAHYPVQFMASMLTAVMGNHGKVAEYVDECRRMNIVVLPPDVNASGIMFAPDKGAIRFGLAAIKNVGTQAMETIINERKDKPYGDLLDLCRHVDLRVCNKRVLESLILGGALDSLPGHRAQLIAMLEDAVEASVKWRKERDDLQLSLFGFVEETNWEIEYPDIRPYDSSEQLGYEREYLGLYISGHPLDPFTDELERMSVDGIHQLPEYNDHSDVLIAGMIVSLKSITTKKGQPMGFLELEDRIGRVEVVLFPESWKQCGSTLQKGELLLVKGKLQLQDEDAKVIANAVHALSGGKPIPREFAFGASRRYGGTAVVGAANGARPGQSRTQERGARTAGERPSVGHSDGHVGGAQSGGRPAGNVGGMQPDRLPDKPASSAPTNAPKPAAERAASGTTQKMYVKISAQRERGAALEKLQTLLQNHKGTMGVVLYYERNQKVLELNEQYAVKPSQLLIKEIELLLGAGTARVK